MSVTKEEITTWFKSLQDSICVGLETCDGKEIFKEEIWQHTEGGGGRTRILQNGNIFEKGGVNFSAVQGILPDTIQKSFKVEKSNFYATGVSIVIHPNHPLVPIIHMNVRYFEMYPMDNPEQSIWWFGGGIDLTPHYIIEEDAKFFHQQLQKTCNNFHPNFYPDFKTWADNYFFIPHRNETRGVGGIFFDRLTENSDFNKADRFNFVKAVGETFLKAYLPIVNKNKILPFTNEQKNWQYIRRSRYVEFNLVYDAGTKFGLETNGRIESILMSLPPQANWIYNFKPEKNSQEEYTINQLKKGIDWV